MMLRVLVILSVASCCFEATQALGFNFKGTLGFLVQHSEVTGVELPGYVQLLTSKKSNLWTKLLHKIFGNKLETKFTEILQTAAAAMPDTATIEDVADDNSDHMSMKNGKIMGLKTIRMTPGSQINIIRTVTGIPVAVIPVQFKTLVVNAELKKKLPIYGNVEGTADMVFLENNFVLKLRLHPGFMQRYNCYLKLYDVFCTDLKDIELTLKRKDGTVNNFGGATLETYFTTTYGVVEQHIESSISNVIYHEVPRASQAICDNKKPYVKLSKYQTAKNSVRTQQDIMKMLENDKSQDQEKKKQAMMALLDKEKAQADGKKKEGNTKP